MKKLKLFSVFCGAFLLCGFLAQPALAIPGDFNGDGVTNSADLTSLMLYLFVNGDPPVNPIDADVDGTAGINLGDFYELNGYLFLYTMCGSLEPYTGVGPSFSEIRFNLFPALPPGPLEEPFNVSLRIITNPGPDLTAIVIPFSYQNDPGSVEVTLNSADFTGSVVPLEWSKSIKIDNDNKKALLYLWANPTPLPPPLTTGTTGLVATLNFTRTANPAGPATYLRPTIFPPAHSPMLIGSFCVNGTPPSDRIMIPKPAKNGDLTLDGLINPADLSFLINWLFVYGPYQSIW
jgi:hypothetical protein